PLRPRPETIDYYYDPSRASIARVIVNYVGGRRQMLCDVTAWDALGTNAQWPRKMAGQMLDVSAAATKPVGQTMFGSIDGFNAGKDSEVDAAAQARAAVSMFVGIHDDLCRSLLYAPAVAA